MRLARICAVPVVLVVLAAGCAKNSNSNPASPSVQPCRANNTADVTFENRSTSNKTYNVVWDGSSLVSISPGQTSRAFSVAAGVQHTLQFRVANSSTVACATSTPTPAQCYTYNYWCTY